MTKLASAIPLLSLLLVLGSPAWADHESDGEWIRHSHPHGEGHHDEYDGGRDASNADHLDRLGLGPYLGLHFVGGLEAYRNGARRKIGGNRNAGESYGFGARLGYRFHPHMSLEVHSEWLEGFDLQQFAGDHSEIRTWTNTLNGKFFLGHGRLQPYALAGAGLQRAWVRNPTPGGVNFDDVAFVGRVGGGLDLALTDHVGLNLEASYLVPTGDLDDYDTVSIGLGLTYRF